MPPPPGRGGYGDQAAAAGRGGAKGSGRGLGKGPGGATSVGAAVGAMGGWGGGAAVGGYSGSGNPTGSGVGSGPGAPSGNTGRPPGAPSGTSAFRDGKLSVSDLAQMRALATLDNPQTEAQARARVGKYGTVQRDNVVSKSFLNQLMPVPVISLAETLGLDSGLDTDADWGNVIMGTVDPTTEALGKTLFGHDDGAQIAENVTNQYSKARRDRHNQFVVDNARKAGAYVPENVPLNVQVQYAQANMGNGGARRLEGEAAGAAGNGLAPGAELAPSPEAEARQNDYLDWLHGRGRYASTNTPDMGTVPLSRPAIPAA